MHQLQSLTLHFFNHDSHNCGLAFLVFRQKHQSGAVFAFFRHWNALKKNEFVWNLNHNPGAVACLVVGTLCAAVLHVFKHCQGCIDQFVGFVTIDVDEHAHTACIVFVGRVIQPQGLVTWIVFLVYLLGKKIVFVQIFFHNPAFFSSLLTF